MIIIVVFVLVTFLLFYLVATYNKLVKFKTLVAEAWSSIDVMLKKRHDLIPNLVETVKGYAGHEQETFKKVIEARNRASAANSLQDQEAAENQLNRAVTGLLALAEQYPDLKANSNFLQLQNDLAVIETDIEKSRRYYNGTVRENNILVDSFPSNIIANMFGFIKSAFFEMENIAERAVPQVSFK